VDLRDDLAREGTCRDQMACVERVAERDLASWQKVLTGARAQNVAPAAGAPK
jgi:hypothetical protein